MKFDELYQLKANNWQLPEKLEKKVKFGVRLISHTFNFLGESSQLSSFFGFLLLLIFSFF